jgi:multiple sugar transport system substrate-binding protein
MSDQKGARNLKRRDFLRLAALGSAGAVAAACAAPTPQVLEKVITQVVEVEKPVEKIVEKPVEKVVEKIVTPTPKPAPEKVAYLRFLTQETDPNEVAVYRRMIADFEAQNPDIKIELQLTGPDQIIERMVAALSAGVTTLDMIQPNPAMGFMLASKDALLPIDDIVAKLGGDDFFYDNSVMKLNDKRYGVPFGGGAGVIWYRKDYFDADGIKVPTTWPEFAEVCKHFTKKFNPQSPTEFGLTLPFSMHQATYLFGAPFFWAAGSEIFDKDLNIVFDSEATQEALEYYSSLYQYTSEASTGYAWGDMINNFLAGQSAMSFYLGRMLGRTYSSAPDLVGKVQAMAYPKHKLQVTADDPNYYVINAKTAYPEQCKRWLEYTLTSPLQYDFLCSIPSHLPPATKDQEKWWNQATTGCKELDENPDIKKVMGDAVGYAYNPYLNSGGVHEALKQGKDRYVPTGAPNPLAVATEGTTMTYASAIQNVVVKGMDVPAAIKAVMPSTEAAVEALKKEVGW